jgi:hypothetical protein
MVFVRASWRRNRCARFRRGVRGCSGRVRYSHGTSLCAVLCCFRVLKMFYKKATAVICRLLPRINSTIAGPQGSRKLHMIHLTTALGRRAVLVTLALITAPLQATTYTLEPDYTQGVFHRNHALYAEPRHWARWLTISQCRTGESDSVGQRLELP